MTFTGPNPALPMSTKTIKTELDEIYKRKWDERWTQLTDCRLSREYIKGPHTRDLKHLNRRDLRRVTTCLTGHGNIGHHLHAMKLKDNPSCPHCGAEDEDPDHHIGKCPRFMNQRAGAFGRPILHDKEWTQSKPRNIIRFINQTQRPCLIRFRYIAVCISDRHIPLTNSAYSVRVRVALCMVVVGRAGKKGVLGGESGDHQLV